MKTIIFNMNPEYEGEPFDGVEIRTVDEDGAESVWLENSWGYIDQWLLYAPLDEPVILKVEQ